LEEVYEPGENKLSGIKSEIFLRKCIKYGEFMVERSEKYK
jgi:hypothetical protein